MLYLFLHGRREASCAGREYFTGDDDEVQGGLMRGGVSILRAVMMRPREASCAGREYFTGGDDEAQGRHQARERERFTAVVMRPSSRKRAAAEK